MVASEQPRGYPTTALGRNPAIGDATGHVRQDAPEGIAETCAACAPPVDLGRIAPARLAIDVGLVIAAAQRRTLKIRLKTDDDIRPGKLIVEAELAAAGEASGGGAVLIPGAKQAEGVAGCESAERTAGIGADVEPRP